MKIDEPFQSEADKYAAYLETPEGRLRLDLPFANLREFLSSPAATGSSRALDLGCGTGANGLRLARLGYDVMLMDSSVAMLEIAKRAAKEAGLLEKIETKQGDANLADPFDEAAFDVILCHNILEFVEDPVAVLRSAARALRTSSGILSVLVRNRAGEVLKAAILSGDVDAAACGLTAEWGNEALYGGKVRLFTPEATRSMLRAASLEVFQLRASEGSASASPPYFDKNSDSEPSLEKMRAVSTYPSASCSCLPRARVLKRSQWHWA